MLNEATVGATAASAIAVTSDDIFALVDSLDQEWMEQPTSGLMMHPTTYKRCRLLKDISANRIFTRRYGEPPNLDGHRVFFNKSMTSTLSTGLKPILCGDFSRLVLRYFPYTLHTLNERYAGTNEIAFVGQQNHAFGFAQSGDPIKSLQLA